MKKIFSFIVAILLISSLFGVSTLAVSHNTDEINASQYIRSMSATTVPTGSGNLAIEFAVTGTGTMTKLGASVIKLYKSDGGLVTTFSYLSYPSLMASNTGFHYGSVPYSGVSGQEYYAIVTFYARNNNGSDSKTFVTSIEAA